MRVRIVLFSILALGAIDGPDMAMGQNRSTFTVDGDPMDWGGEWTRSDEYADVIPDYQQHRRPSRLLVAAVERIFYPRGAEPDTLVTFLFQFVAPALPGRRGDDGGNLLRLVGERHLRRWRSLRGPTSGRTTWSESPAATAPSRRSSTGAHTGSGWDKKEGADIPELDIAFATRYLEGAMYWQLLDIPDTDRPHYEVESYNSTKAVRVSKGAFRDYAPNGDHPLREQHTPVGC